MNSLQERIINHLYEEVKKRFTGEGTGHDWWHIQRVYNTASYIATHENADLFIVKAGALLHDIADHKFHENYEEVAKQQVKHLMEIGGADEKMIKIVNTLVNEISFRGAGVPDEPGTIEAKIVQDADRLDAMGAIGIARAFSYGGSKGRSIYNPGEKPGFHTDFESYRKSESSTLHHFYEKLLLLYDRLHTDTAKELGAGRNTFMKQYLEQFYVEWHGSEIRS
jgi:uncharacterized protein